MKYFSIFQLLILTLLCQNLSAQADFNAMAKIALKTTWQKGDSHQYELKKGKISYLNNTEESRSDNRQLVTLSVLESNAKGYVIEAVYNSAAYFLPDDLRNLKGINELVAKYSDVKVRYAINTLGEFQGVLNGRELQKMIGDLFSVVSSSKAVSGMESTVLTNMKCQMTSEVYITEGLFQELRLLHQFYGNEYPNNVMQEYETQLANMLVQGGTPIPAHAQLHHRTQPFSRC
jgi:hypothetical protein